MLAGKNTCAVQRPVQVTCKSFRGGCDLAQRHGFHQAGPSFQDSPPDRLPHHAGHLQQGVAWPAAAQSEQACPMQALKLGPTLLQANTQLMTTPNRQSRPDPCCRSSLQQQACA